MVVDLAALPPGNTRDSVNMLRREQTEAVMLRIEKVNTMKEDVHLSSKFLSSY